MVFSTYLFVFGFLPLVFAIYALCVRTGRTDSAKWTLVVASLAFYAYGSGGFFPWFVASVLFNYAMGRVLAAARGDGEHGSRRARALLAAGLVANVVLLGVYKYTDFVIFNLNEFLGAELPYQHIVLPIGISFFTFQLVAYLVDSYRGSTRGYRFLDYLLFITFFPQLIVGPIVHHKDVVPQYERLEPSRLSSSGMAPGVFLFAVGCAKKLVFADPLTGWSQRAFDHAEQLSMLDAWGASLGYTLSYYFDLSGYADMAIGLGLLFGIQLPINFDSPYKARNFADYWRRWHITLSRFLGDYVFHGVYRKGAGSANFYWAIFVTFLVSGFWHGAGWTFVVWGVLNGLFVMASHAMTRREWSLPGPLAWGLTFLGVIGVRILFVSGSFDDALHVMASAVDVGSFSLNPADNAYLALKQPVYLLVALAIVLFLPNSNQLKERFRPSFGYALATASLLLLSLLDMAQVKGFLYFQF